MTRKQTDTIKYFVKAAIPALMVFFAFTYCARPLAPQGGPIDSLPPALLSASPAAGTTNFTGKRVTLTFDEYIKLKDQYTEFFISPFMERTPNLSERGKSIVVDIRDTLLPDQTYSLNFGASITDYNEGNPLTGFRYVFSTGDVIDSLMMSAYTVDGSTNDTVGNVFIMFFADGDDYTPEYDSTLYNNRPLAAAKTFRNGIGIVENLKPMDYRVYAVEDNNNNQTYEPGVDRVAFIDSLYNPATAPPFDTWYDQYRMYWQADPQMLFRLFMEEPFRRMSYTNSSRSEQGKIEVNFSAPHPLIESLTLNDIDPSRIYTEYLSADKDSMILWIDRPETLPDTLFGEILYHRHDSVNSLYLDTVKLRLPWQKPSAGRGRNRDAAVADTVATPLGFSASPSQELNPQRPVYFSFDYPLTRIDTTLFEVSKITGPDTKQSIPYTFTQDTVKIREWVMKADWEPKAEYRIFITPGALENIMGQVNDSATLNLKTLDPDDYGKVTVNITGKTPESKYIVQLFSARRMVEEKTGLTTGSYSFEYVPTGESKIRIIEDMDGNGKWDSGNLLARIQPERVEMFLTETGAEEFTVRVGWFLTYSLDMNTIFSPINMENMKTVIERRNAKYLKEYQRRMEQERNNPQNQNNNQQGMGFGNAMNSITSGNNFNLGQ